MYSFRLFLPPLDWVDFDKLSKQFFLPLFGLTDGIANGYEVFVE